MSKLPLLIEIPLDDVLERYSPDLAAALKDTGQSNPKRAAALRKGWQEDLEHYTREKIEPVYGRLRRLNPIRMHHNWELWEEIEADLKESLEDLLDIWRTELKGNRS